MDRKSFKSVSYMTNDKIQYWQQILQNVRDFNYDPSYLVRSKYLSFNHFDKFPYFYFSNQILVSNLLFREFNDTF